MKISEYSEGIQADKHISLIICMYILENQHREA